MSSFAAGSSPLTRGKRLLCLCERVARGLIPAHAGKTVIAASRLPHAPAHPRSRGENELTEYACDDDTGSSPLTRGKLELRALKRDDTRLIPAHAGKTDLCRADGQVTEAHPRSRGENHGAAGVERRRGGSSPLTRGKRIGGAAPAINLGLIPAHAGKTGSLSVIRTPAPAHPRSRGENYAPKGGAGTVSGSSPLTRGKGEHAADGLLGRGLIPAHAGKTPSGPSVTRPGAAHPRSRGENGQESSDEGAPSGSSPLTRGKRGGADH